MTLLLQRMACELMTGEPCIGISVILQVGAKSVCDCVHTDTPHMTDMRLLIDIAKIRECIDNGHIEDMVWRPENI